MPNIQDTGNPSRMARPQRCATLWPLLRLCTPGRKHRRFCLQGEWAKNFLCAVGVVVKGSSRSWTTPPCDPAAASRTTLCANPIRGTAVDRQPGMGSSLNSKTSHFIDPGPGRQRNCRRDLRPLASFGMKEIRGVIDRLYRKNSIDSQLRRAHLRRGSRVSRRRANV